MTVQVWDQRLRDAAAGWEDQGDDLYGARKSLSGAGDSVSLLGSRVSGAAASFITTWSNTIEALRKEADQHSVALVETASEFLVSDQDTVDAMHRLLSWDDRFVAPGGPYGPAGLLGPGIVR